MTLRLQDYHTAAPAQLGRPLWSLYRLHPWVEHYNQDQPLNFERDEKLYISCNLTSFQNTNLNVCALPFPTTPCNISAYLVLLNGWYIFNSDDTSRSDDVQCTYYVFGLATPTHICNSWRSFINFNLRTSCCLPSPYSVDCACCRIVCNISCLWFMVCFSLPPPTTYPPKKFQIWKSSHRRRWGDTCKV